MLHKPPTLKPGDQVGIVSLSQGTLGEDFAAHQRQLGVKRLEELGLKPVFMPNALKGIAYLAAHPEARAADLKTAFLNPEIKGIFCAIGGDDTYRLLPYLMTDTDFIQAVTMQPKIFSGFSDTTINHLMFYRLGLRSFYGPNFLNDLAELDHKLLPFTQQTLRHYFENPAVTDITASPVWYEERTDFSERSLGTPRVSHPETHGFEVLRGRGKIKGALLGGCLDSFYDILTTNRYPDEAAIVEKYQLFPDAKIWRRKILFIETSEEQPKPALYRAMLQTLAQQGVLAAVAGIIVGKPQNERYYEDYKAALLQATAAYQTPIIYNVNFGHAYPRIALPYGAEALLDLDQGRIQITEPYFAEN
ncbi:MAG: LD-carboxypeptidase [Lactobacillus sp.]|jgi:muramoyltetrapeptide carboxypeptidase LdcA involved in peptidoglycan recycling|nr:LD-carboxypeptidase [Lactobacillus sp.]